MWKWRTSSCCLDHFLKSKIADGIISYVWFHVSGQMDWILLNPSRILNIIQWPDGTSSSSSPHPNLWTMEKDYPGLQSEPWSYRSTAVDLADRVVPGLAADVDWKAGPRARLHANPTFSHYPPGWVKQTLALIGFVLCIHCISKRV